MAGPVKEWDEHGNPVQGQAVQEWDEHGNPVSSSQGQASTQVAGAQGYDPSAQAQGMRQNLASIFAKPLEYGKEIAGGVERGYESLKNLPSTLLSPRNPDEVKYGPVGRALLHTGQDIGGGLANAYNASAKSRDSGENWAGQTLAFGENAPIIGGMVRYAEQGGTQPFNPKSVGAAAEGTTLAATPYAIEKGVGAAGDAVGAARTAADVRGVAQNEGVAFRAALQSTAHDILTRTANSAKQKLWTAYNNVSQRVGALKGDLVASDVAQSAGEPSISVSDMWPLADELATKFKAAGGKLPKFDAAMDAIANRKDAYGTPKEALTLDELMNLRSEVGDLWNKSASGTRDSAAVKELYDGLAKKIQDRTAELDQTEKYNAYNKLWSTVQKYKGQGALGDLLNAPLGKDFFDVLTDPKQGAELGRTFDDLQKFGLKKGLKAELIAKHGDLYDYAKNSSPNLGMGGRIKAIARHPVLGGAGMMAGGALGSALPVAGTFIGGTLGALKGAELGDTLRGLKAIRETGGVPSRTGEFGSAADVMPSGQSPEDAAFAARVAKAAALRDTLEGRD